MAWLQRGQVLLAVAGLLAPGVGMLLVGGMLRRPCVMLQPPAIG